MCTRIHTLHSKHTHTHTHTHKKLTMYAPHTTQSGQDAVGRLDLANRCA